MHYYQHHIGDYKAATTHLSNEEDLAYRRLLEMYYDTEAPIVGDMAVLSRKLRVTQEAIQVVLEDFFTCVEGTWVQSRCAKEITSYQAMKAGGKAGADKRWAKGSDAPPIPTLSPAQTEGNANHEPVTMNHEPVNTSMSPAKLPTVPTQAVIDLYHQTLPELPTCRLLSDGRKKAISTFWKWVLTSKRSDGQPRATTEDEALLWITSYFCRARDNDFLMGRLAQVGSHANWVCDLDFLLTEKGKKHVIEKTREAA